MSEEKSGVASLRLPQVLEIFPISKSSWWQGCKEGNTQSRLNLAQEPQSGGQPILKNLWLKSRKILKMIQQKNNAHQFFRLPPIAARSLPEADALSRPSPPGG